MRRAGGDGAAGASSGFVIERFPVLRPETRRGWSEAESVRGVVAKSGSLAVVVGTVAGREGRTGGGERAVPRVLNRYARGGQLSLATTGSSGQMDTHIQRE